MWTSRRAKLKCTSLGNFNFTVAGGLSYGETPLEVLVREASERLTLPQLLIRRKAKTCGTIMFVCRSDNRLEGSQDSSLWSLGLSTRWKLQRILFHVWTDSEAEQITLLSIQQTILVVALGLGQLTPVHGCHSSGGLHPPRSPKIED